MTRPHHILASLLSRTKPLLPVLLLLLLPSARALAQAPKAGDVQRLQVASVSLAVGWTEKETRRVTYTPPPGWYVRSHRVECRERYGLSSYAVSTVPAGWDASGEDARAESAQDKVAAALRAPAPGAGGQAKAVLRAERTASERHQRFSSHHALVVEATAQGAGYFRGGGGIELTVTAELVYLGAGDPAVGGGPAREAWRHSPSR